MRLSLPLAVLPLLLPALPAAATEAHGGGHHASGMPFEVFRGGHHAFHRHHPFHFHAMRHPFVGPGDWGLGWGWGGGGGDGGWGWGEPAAAGLAEPAPSPGLGMLPPPPPMRTADERPSVESTPQGVTIVRGPGSHHLPR